MRIVSLLLGVALLIGCSNAGAPKGASRVVEQQTVKQNTVDFINGLGQANPGKKAFELTVTPGSGVYNDAISYSKEISNPQGMAQYTGAFTGAGPTQISAIGVYHHIYVIDDAISKLEHIEVVRLFNEQKEELKSYIEGEIFDVLLIIYEYEIVRVKAERLIIDGVAQWLYTPYLKLIRKRTNYSHLEEERAWESLRIRFHELKEEVSDLQIMDQDEQQFEYKYEFYGASQGRVFILEGASKPSPFTRITKDSPLAIPELPPRPPLSEIPRVTGGGGARPYIPVAPDENSE